MRSGAKVCSVPVCTLFSRLPQASLLRSDSFFSGAVCFVRRTFARSAFHGFSIWFQRCKSYLFAKFGVGTAETGPLKVCEKFEKNWKNMKKHRRATSRTTSSSNRRSWTTPLSSSRESASRCQRERSVKIKLKIKKIYFENKSNTILKIKDLAANIKWFSSKN